MPASQRNKLVPAGMGHPKVQWFRDIRHNRRPNPHAAVALEGLWSVDHAVAAGVPIDAGFVCPPLVRGPATMVTVDRLAAAGVPVFEVSERVLRRMVDRDGPDGLAAIARLPARSLEGLTVTRASRLLVADSCELAGNLGTLIRCADGAGASAVIVTDRRVRLTHPLVVKASMGTIFTMPVVVAPSRPDAARWLRGEGATIIGAHPDADVSYRAARYGDGGPVAIVVGSERHGLSPFWRDAADALVSIPMLGAADSLNVGHAAALLLYEALART